MKKNIVFRLAVILFIATVISACLVSRTYAKYAQADDSTFSHSIVDF